tara:strand:+ start:2920 stop:3090 length:171 start_codon:yes stop_codon:yes gene_type:complete
LKSINPNEDKSSGIKFFGGAYSTYSNEIIVRDSGKLNEKGSPDYWRDYTCAEPGAL